MAERFDVVVVGARCAGSPLATLLARAGVRVAVIERATFPRDTLSTHIFQAHALAFLDRLGVTERLRATGAPLLERGIGRMEDVEWSIPWPQRPGDVGGAASIRRFVLDPILAETAAEAGAEMRFASNVTGIVEENGRVRGVRVGRNGAEHTLEAELVVGADGRNSTISRMVGARKYNLTPNERFAYWSFFEGADPGPDPAVIFYRSEGRFVIACPADQGLYQVIAIPELSDLPRFREDLEGSFLDYARRCEPVAEVIPNARRVGKIFGMLRWEGFLREAAGPGWVLAGDAGYFKDPAPGQGIGDAFLQVDALAPEIVAALGGSDGSLDTRLAAWWRWRDKDVAEHYWYATDLGKAGRAPAPLVEAARRMAAKDQIAPLLDVFNHRIAPSRAVSPARIFAATGRLLTQPGCDRRAILREVRELVEEDFRRKRLNRRPAYVPLDASIDAGPTEVAEAPALA
jgi:flavin-dependent dehydrogenase